MFQPHAGSIPPLECQPTETGATQWTSLRAYVALALVIIGIKAFVALCGYHLAQTGELSIRDYEKNHHQFELISRYTNPKDIRFFELWVQSDAQWYAAIAADGYPTIDEFKEGRAGPGPKMIDRTDTQLKYAFFPLWPILIRTFHAAFDDWFTAGYIASNLCSLLAFLLLYRLLSKKAGTTVAYWSIVLYATWPFSMFFSAPFTESLFLLWVVITFAMTEKRMWMAAGFAAGLASITRPNGLVLFAVPVLGFSLSWLRTAKADRVSVLRLSGLTVGLVPIAAYLIHNAIKTGDPFQFMNVTAWWGYDQGISLSNLWQNTVGTLTRFSELPWHGFHSSKLDFAVLASFSIVLIMGVRVLAIHEFAYAAAVMLVPLLTKDLMSFSRYALVAWPVFFIIPRLIRERLVPWTCGVLAMVFLALQVAVVGEFVNWHWVG